MIFFDNLLMSVLIILNIFIFGGAFYLRSRFLLHMMQLEEYKNNNYLNWIEEFKYRVFPSKIMYSIAAILVLAVIATIINGVFGSIIYPVIWAILIAITVNIKKEKAKKELVFTPRAKRLLASSIIVTLVLLIIFVLIYCAIVDDFHKYYPIMLLLVSLLYLFAPYSLYLGNVLVAPVEKSINRHYYELARNKVKSFEGLKIVGITGSYGKTSTKFITTKILEEKFNVLMTPESYNTPMGVSKVINNTLNKEHEVFVVEMGARIIGEIKEMAELANPQIGVITSIGPTHLDTFKNIENIMKTKYELIEELPADGIAIFNYDNQYVKKLADKTFKEKILYGMESTEKLDLYAENIQVNETGSVFTLRDKEGNSTLCRTQLLGRHNISNLLAAAAVGKAWGLTLEEISKGIEKVEPVPHRLQLINPGTGVIVIDDAFNSNPISSKAALEVISQFKEGSKIIVTPGMVELGDQEEEANRQFGRYIAESCDYVILVGKNRTKPIYEGIVEEGFNSENVFVVSSLDEGTKILQSIVKPKDVVLFENDLPDTYNE